MDWTAIGKIALGFAIIITSHEFGHALAAILCGVPVKRFSIGIGPGIKIPFPKINYLIISPFVVGGFVELDEEALSEKSFLKKLLVYSAGMLMNVFLAIAILMSLGVSFLKATLASFTTWLGGWFIFFNKISTGEVGVDAISGPVGIGKLFMGERYWFVVALISLSIAMFNLLPIPPLDGGRIFISGLEKIIGKGNAALVNRILTVFGVVALLCLLVFATFMDFAKLTH